MRNLRPSASSIESRRLGLRWFAVVFGVLVAASAASPRGWAAVTIGGPFELVAPDGRIVTDQTFRGKWLLVYFGYTSCPQSCPTTLAAVTEALARLGPAAAKVQAIFVTLDPRHDTRKVMGDYTSAFDPRILGLTGAPLQIAAVVKAYGVYVQPHDPGSSEAGTLLDHSTYLYLMGPDGRFERALDHEPPAETIMAALQAAMARFLDTGAGGPATQSAPVTH